MLQLFKNFFSMVADAAKDLFPKVLEFLKSIPVEYYIVGIALIITFIALKILYEIFVLNPIIWKLDRGLTKEYDIYQSVRKEKDPVGAKDRHNLGIGDASFSEYRNLKHKIWFPTIVFAKGVNFGDEYDHPGKYFHGAISHYKSDMRDYGTIKDEYPDDHPFALRRIVWLICAIGVISTLASLGILYAATNAYNFYIWDWPVILFVLKMWVLLSVGMAVFPVVYYLYFLVGKYCMTLGLSLAGSVMGFIILELAHLMEWGTDIIKDLSLKNMTPFVIIWIIFTLYGPLFMLYRRFTEINRVWDIALGFVRHDYLVDNGIDWEECWNKQDIVYNIIKKRTLKREKKNAKWLEKELKKAKG